MKTALSNDTRGVNINGIPIHNLRYADDTVLIASILQDLQILLNKVNEESEEYGLNKQCRTNLTQPTNHQTNRYKR